MQPVDRSNTLAHTVLGRRMLVGFTLLMTYGGGLWLNLLHEVEGATEIGAPPAPIHWLRDSTLSLPLVGLGVLLGAALARRLVDRYGRNAPEIVIGALMVVVLALYASILLAAGNPIHGILFPLAVHGGGHDLPLGIHMVRDGLLALSANEVLAASIVGVVLSRRWMMSVSPGTNRRAASV